MSEVYPLYVPAPYQDAVDSGRVILRDGSTATIRVATIKDAPAVVEFFHRLSPESRERRFFSLAEPSAKTVASLCDSSDPHSRLTLVVTRTSGGKDVILAVGSYIASGDGGAEVAFAVDDPFQGKGIGTQLLERLALLATRAGITRFWAVTKMENRGMIEVFRRSGFPLNERFDRGYLEIDFSVYPTEASVLGSEMRDRVFTAASIRPFFQPRAVAVIGASRNPASIGRRILDALVAAGFEGSLYPINPKANEISSI